MSVDVDHPRDRRVLRQVNDLRVARECGARLLNTQDGVTADDDDAIGNDGPVAGDDAGELEGLKLLRAGRGGEAEERAECEKPHPLKCVGNRRYTSRMQAIRIHKTGGRSEEHTSELQ